MKVTWFYVDTSIKSSWYKIVGDINKMSVYVYSDSEHTGGRRPEISAIVDSYKSEIRLT